MNADSNCYGENSINTLYIRHETDYSNWITPRSFSSFYMEFNFVKLIAKAIKFNPRDTFYAWKSVFFFFFLACLREFIVFLFPSVVSHPIIHKSFSNMRIFRWYIENTGNLIIRDVNSEDDGSYTCVASNLAGVRKSKPIVLATQSKFWSIFFNETVELLFTMHFCDLSSTSVHDPSPQRYDRHGGFQRTITVQNRRNSTAGSVLEKNIEHRCRTTHKAKSLQVIIYSVLIRNVMWKCSSSIY